MGKLTGLLMIVAGVGTAAYVYPLISADPESAEQQAADVAAISTAATAQPKRAAPPVFVQAPAAASAPRIISAEAQPGRPVLAPPSIMTAPVTAAVAPLPAAPLFVAQAPQPMTSPAITAKPLDPPVPQPARRKAEDEAKLTLARDIQRELKRVGCLTGETDGSWNSATRQAMKSFIDRVNASLPTDEPDHILKTLVQGHPGNACAKGCPSGQAASADGRCLPTAIMTQGPSPAKRPAETAPMSPSPPTPTVALAQPPPAPAPRPVVGAPSASSSWETSTTTVAIPTMAAIAAAAAAPMISEPKRAAEALPGRMAVGAPLTPEPAQPNQSPVTTFRDDESRSKIVLKPKSAARPDIPDDNADKPERTEKPAARPSVGAVTAVERTSPPARVAAYRASPPPPRYVGAYSPPPVREARPRFGPQIFRQLDLSGR